MCGGRDAEGGPGRPSALGREDGTGRRGRGEPWGMLTYLPAARRPGSDCSPRVASLTSGYPGTLSCFCRGRRRPAAQTPNFRRRRWRRRRRRRLSRQMGVTCGRRGCACAAFLFSPEPARLTCPEDEDGRYALCVSRSFHPGRHGQPGRGKGEQASTLGAGAVGGRACASPRVGALRGGGSAPC